MAQGRLKNLVSWATGNYSSGGAWNGTAKRVANVARYFVPGVGGAAQWFNDIFGELVDAVNAVNNTSGQLAALNWRTQDTTGHGIQHVKGLTYDQRYGRWVAYGYSTSTNAQTVSMSVDGGNSWSTQGGQNFSSGTISNQIRGLIYRPDTGRCAVASYPGVVDSTAVVDEEARLALVTGEVVTGIWFNGLHIFAGNTGAGALTLKTCPGGGVTTWTSRTASPAAGWNSCPAYYADTSGSKVMIVGGQNANYGAFILSSDGITWSAGTITTASGWYIYGACYAGDRWVVGQTNGTDTKIYTSQNDGGAWTLAATLTGVVMSGMHAIGSLLFLATYTHTTILGAYSTDGGVSWRFGTYYTYTPGTPGFPDQTVVSSGSSFGAFNGTNRVNVSNAMGQPGTAFP